MQKLQDNSINASHVQSANGGPVGTTEAAGGSIPS